jgi:hypothetical protein
VTSTDFADNREVQRFSGKFLDFSWAYQIFANTGAFRNDLIVLKKREYDAKFAQFTVFCRWSSTILCESRCEFRRLRSGRTLTEGFMKTLITTFLLAACLATFAQAGGPVVVVEEPEPEVEEGAASSKGLLPWLILPLVVCVVFCGPEDP